MFTYFKFFVFLLFPPAAFLLLLLVLPLPILITKKIINVCDAILFCKPHPYIPISLFWCVLILSFFTFYETYVDMKMAYVEYHSAKLVGNFDRALVRLMAEERNAWISGFAFVLWALLHRYRNLLKKYFDLIDMRTQYMNVPIRTHKCDDDLTTKLQEIQKVRYMKDYGMKGYGMTFNPKSEEIKSEEIKSEEIKSEETKKKE